jgi:hypothetical protein
LRAVANITCDWQFISRLIDLHQQGKFPVERVSKVYPVADFEKVIADMKNGTVRLPGTDISCSYADTDIRSSNQ